LIVSNSFLSDRVASSRGDRLASTSSTNVVIGVMPVVVRNPAFAANWREAEVLPLVRN
jgi:hypothetical protein